jgi:beta-ureidopropionase / N-carbamoyl-L-amino-acid hydrolase
MPLRRDAVQALGQYIHELNDVFAPLVTERTVWTLGRVTVEPNAPSIVPGHATVSVQMRDAEIPRLEAMHRVAHDLARREDLARGLAVLAEAAGAIGT